MNNNNNNNTITPLNPITSLHSNDLSSNNSLISFSVIDPYNPAESFPATDDLPALPAEPQLSNSARMLSATIGALITSLVVTPFDVVKTRIQSQIHFRSINPAALLDSCSHYQLQSGLVDVWCHKCDLIASPPYPHSNNSYIPVTDNHNHNLSSSNNGIIRQHLHQSEPIRFSGSFDAFIKLLRYEGPSSLWRGLSPTLIHSIPSTVMYFWLYDKLKIYYNQNINNQWTQWTPLIAGISARAITTTLVSPIELIKTKQQSLSTSSSIVKLVKGELNKGGLFSLWRGAGPTLLRDVPFSAIYWMLYERIKPNLLRYSLTSQSTAVINSKSFINTVDQSNYHRLLVWSSFLSGAISGMIAATITHPFDLIKTRRQIEMYSLIPNNINNNNPPSSSTAVFRSIVSTEGYIGLFSGLGARIGKIAPACAIMISTYEFAKAKFGESQQQQQQRQQLN